MRRGRVPEEGSPRPEQDSAGLFGARRVTSKVGDKRPWPACLGAEAGDGASLMALPDLRVWPGCFGKEGREWTQPGGAEGLGWPRPWLPCTPHSPAHTICCPCSGPEADGPQWAGGPLREAAPVAGSQQGERVVSQGRPPCWAWGSRSLEGSKQAGGRPAPAHLTPQGLVSQHYTPAGLKKPPESPGGFHRHTSGWRLICANKGIWAQITWENLAK